MIATTCTKNTPSCVVLWRPSLLSLPLCTLTTNRLKTTQHALNLLPQQRLLRLPRPHPANRPHPADTSPMVTAAKLRQHSISHCNICTGQYCDVNICLSRLFTLMCRNIFSNYCYDAASHDSVQYYQASIYLMLRNALAWTDFSLSDMASPCPFALKSPNLSRKHCPMMFDCG